ncbi:hypothetical protein EVG20_g2752 [Dentipellis fragilis]|uniref:Thioredoxin domain-containing protein n=1 Tax=Dentipellis fragilis TaxID=205917 RepID=A0A4Y9Z5V3_9AGAM|nr:hypothetical protein EVG20_g2752 [Dentipellis fragilis]
MLPQLLALSLALAPSVVSAALFPSNSLVKFLDAKSWKQAMKANQTSVVAFVAPWCGHCQKMAPEYSKAALGLYPLIPTYAVDCDAQKNRALCAEQGVQGFPTIKLFPRGLESKPILFDTPERTASAFYYWAIRRIPHKVKKLYQPEDVPPWITKHIDKNRVLLLNKGKAMPMLWEVLGNKYRDLLEFGHNRDRKGKASVLLGYPKGGKKESKVLFFPAGSEKSIRFEGLLKLESLSKFFDSILDGTADLSAINEELAHEEYTLTPEEEEIERQQEAQRMALAHGGFSDMTDFEEAVKKYGKDFHGKHGFAGMMGDIPMKKKEGDAGAGAKEEDPIHKILKAQKEKAEKAAEASRQVTPKTDEGGQIVMEVPTDTMHPETGKPTPTAAEETEASVAPTASSSVTEEASVDKKPTPSDPAPPPPTSSSEPVVEDTPEAPDGECGGHVKDEL